MEIDFKYSGFSENELCSKDNQRQINEIHKKLNNIDKSFGTAWVSYPTDYDKKELAKIVKLAKTIEANSDVLLVVGIGGSYMGARAGIEFCGNHSNLEIVFAGTSFDYDDLSKKLDMLKNKDVTVNVISKSGTTVEILSTLLIVEKFLKNKYKGDYKSRLIFTTDKQKGYLRQRANQEGIETLSVPDNMGGRYSVLSAVGLLPFACCGLNIKKILEGAAAAQFELNNDNLKNNNAYKYAVYRNLVAKKYTKKIEMFSLFNQKLSGFGLWLQQLFAESEGKDKKGMFVCSQVFSTDLHSVGQFLQAGSPIFAETFLMIQNSQKDVVLSNITLDSPIKYLDGKPFSSLNKAAYNGTLKAHNDADLPIISITIDEANEYNFGYLVYFFELSCAASGLLLGINPFNQPGVEQYKNYMKEELKN